MNMDKCKYYLNLDGVTKVFNSDLELTAFIKNKIADTSDTSDKFKDLPEQSQEILSKLLSTGDLNIKFSKLEDGLITKQEEVIQKIKDKKGLSTYSSDYASTHKFLHEEHIIDGHKEMLTPGANNETYLLNGVNHLLEHDVKLQELSKTDPLAAKMKAGQMIKEDIELGEKMQHISIETSTEIKKLLSNQFWNPDVILASIIEYNLRITNKKKSKFIDPEEVKKLVAEIPKETKQKFKQKFETWKQSLISTEDKILTNVYLSQNLENDPLKGINTIIPYVSVSKDGLVDIYDLRISRNPITDWPSAKLAMVDYTLGINRQLLSNLVPIKESSLFIQPIIFPTDSKNQILIDDIYIGTPMDRSRIDSKSQLGPTGTITTKIRKVLPAKVLQSIEESNKFDELNKSVFDLAFPKYNIRTKITNLNIDNRYKEIVRQSIDQPKLSFFDSLIGKAVEVNNNAEGRTKLKELLTDYYTRGMEAKNSQLIDLQKAILTAKKGNYDSPLAREIRFGRSSAELQHTFSRYLNNHWQLITGMPQLLNAGILLFRNTEDLTMEAVAITVNALDQINNLGAGTTILGKYRNNESLRDNPRILSASTGHIELMKTLIVLNNDPELLSGYSLNGIRVFNVLENKGDYVDIDTGLYNFNLLLNEVKKYKDIPNNFTGKDSKIKITEYGTALYSEILHLAEQSGLSEFKAGVDKLGNIDTYTTRKNKLDKFLQLKELLDSKFKQLQSLRTDRISDFNDPIIYLNYLISSGIAHYSEINSLFDFNIPRYGVRKGDITHWIQTVMFGSAPEYDKSGKLITGLFQGTYFATGDAMKSRYVAKLRELITIASNQIRSDYNKRHGIIIKNTNDYYAAIGRSDLEKLLIGNAEQYHKVFFETYNGKITNDFKVKNPWDMSVNLNIPQREYLKRFLYNQYISKHESNISLDTFEKFDKSDELKKLLDPSNKELLDDLLKVPLIKKQSLSKYKALTTFQFRAFVGQWWDEVKSQLDYRDLTGTERDGDRQKAGFYESVNGFKRMFNQFHYQESEEARHNMIQQYTTDIFEINLDTIALKYAFETIREKHFNAVLPIINAGILLMQAYGFQTGKLDETEKALEDVTDQLKTAVYSVPLMKSKESEEALSLVKKIQHITSIMTIALRPTLMIRELVVGSIKNASYAWSKMYGTDTFTSKDLADAYGLFFKGGDEFEKMLTINTEFGVANRDVTEIVRKTKVDRYGLNFMSSALYWCNTFPDYINRLSLFFAKMIKDGTYDAYTMDNGQLKYDPSKDSRYSYYFKMRDHYGFKFTGSDKKYDDERNKYLYAIEDFNADRYVLGQDALTEKDLLPSAYSTKERANIRTFINTAHGYYGTEFAPIIKHTAVGILFGQFLTYWPSMVRYYFGPDTTPIRFSRKQKFIQTGDEKIPVFVKWSVDDNGELFKEEIPKDQLKPDDIYSEATEWKGELNQGLMYSLAEVTRALFTGNMHEMDPQKIQQAKLMLHDLTLMISSLILGSILFKDLKKSPKDATKYSQYEEVATKLLYQTTNQFDPFLNTIGSLQGTPMFLTTLAKTKTNFQSAISGKSDLEKFLHKSLQFWELMPVSTRTN